MQIQWLIKKFESLTPYQLYTILQLRNAVFVVEQNCVFQDADHKDEQSWHLMGWSEDQQLMAYCRILPPGLSYKQPSIGRVVTNLVVRKKGAGRELMITAIRYCHHLFGEQDIKIGAQLYLLKFYSSLGFELTGEVYLEDGIEHVEMIRFFKND